MKTKFYEFTQNNSGGSFVTNKKLCHRLVIEAVKESDAEEKAFDMGVYYNGVEDGRDCGCCGDRWSSPSEMLFPYRYGTFSKSEATKKAKKYGADVEKTTWGYLNGKPDPDKYELLIMFFQFLSFYARLLLSSIRLLRVGRF